MNAIADQLSEVSLNALAKVIANNGATVHPQTRIALASRGLARIPFWNQPNYIRPTIAGRRLFRSL